MKAIDFYELQDIRSRDDDDEEAAVIINVLSPEDFTHSHIPGSINIPLNGNNHFVKDVASVLGDRNRPVVVYCAGVECPASTNAAAVLEEAGFTEVSAFEGGMAEWEDLGGDLEADDDDDIADDFGGRGINTPPL